MCATLNMLQHMHASFLPSGLADIRCAPDSHVSTDRNVPSATALSFATFNMLRDTVIYPRDHAKHKTDVFLYLFTDHSLFDQIQASKLPAVRTLFSNAFLSKPSFRWKNLLK